MPLPIVLGGKSVSAQSLPGPCGRPDEADDGTFLQPLELYQTLSWAVCPHREWLMRVTCSYYDLVRSDTSRRDCTMAEVRIQVSPLARPLSTDYRETAHHLKLSDGAPNEYPQSQSQVVVSTDRRNLAVLLFHPHQQSSALVVFQLRRPRTDLNHLNRENPIPLPSYIQTVGTYDHKETEDSRNMFHSKSSLRLPPNGTGSGNNSSSAAASRLMISTRRDPPSVASHPRFVSVWGISAIGCLPASVYPSVYLAVCLDGSIVCLDARSSMAVATGTLPLLPSDLPVSSITPSPTSTMNQGRLLAVTASGKCIVAEWSLKSNRASAESATGTSVPRAPPTLQKRASTGSVVTQTHLDENPTTQLHTLSQVSPPTPSTPSTSNTPNRLQTLLSPMLNRTASGKSLTPSARSGTVADLPALKLSYNKGPKSSSSSPSSDRALQRQIMNDYALAELQKKTAPSPLVEEVQHGPGHDGKGRQPRRRSDLSIQSNSSESEYGAVVDTLKRQMRFQILSTVGPPENGDGDEGGEIVDAMFGSLPSVVCVLYQPDAMKRRVAQVYSLDQKGVLRPLVHLTLTDEQLEQTFKIQSNSRTAANSTTNADSRVADSSTTLRESRFGLDYDPSSDTFAINTVYDGDNRWVGCLWNWRSNVLGWAIQHYLLLEDGTATSNTLWSRLYFANHPHLGNHLVFLETHQDKYLHIRKQLVTTGLLSPSSTLSSLAPGVLEPNSLVLSCNSIRFPYTSQLAALDIRELEWKISNLPWNYRNDYGPPKLAAIGRDVGRSLAVASSKGVCVLDCLAATKNMGVSATNGSHSHWKPFGTPQEELSFQVLAMTWWEGRDISDVGPEDVTEDLLVAIIETNSGRQYLSCWSPKRLDLAHQLLEPIGDKAPFNDGGVGSWGIPLTKGINMTSLSILAEPSRLVEHTPRRAVVLVSSSNSVTSTLDYAYYRFQVSKKKLDASLHVETYHDLKPYSVLVQESIPNGSLGGGSTKGSIVAVMLASAFFDFDLNRSKPIIGNQDGIMATLGVVRTPGGIEAVLVGADSQVQVAKVIDGEEVAKIVLADDVHGSLAKQSKDVVQYVFDAFVWNIELLNGQIICWTVPFRLQDGGAAQFSSLFKNAEIPRPTGLSPPTMVYSTGSNHTTNHLQFGVSCHIGSATDWMQQSTSGTQRDMALGLVPQSGFGCVLRAGQYARKLHRSGIGDFDTDLFATDFLESEVYGPSNFLMMPPAFVPSIYMMLLEAAYLRTELPVMPDSKTHVTSKLMCDEKGRLETIEKHVDSRLDACQNKDAVMMALRLLILRSVGMLSAVDRKHRKAQSDVSKSNLMIVVALFTAIVDVTRRSTTNLQFASLFLEVGRQIEPSCLAHLFPLPQSSGHKSEPGSPRRSFVIEKIDRFDARSVVELFSLCIREGSLAASASALPLLSSRSQSRNYCDLLLTRAMDAVVHNADSTAAKYDISQEERRVIGDIFRFCIKLEDAALFDEQYHDANTAEDNPFEQLYGELPEETFAPELGGGSRRPYETDDSDSDNYVRDSRRNLICVGGSRQSSSILSYVIPSIFDSSKGEEEAIRRAANSFIDSKSNLTSMDFLTLTGEEKDSDSDAYDSFLTEGKKPFQSVAGLVGNLLLDLLRAPKVDHPWKAMAALSRLILQQSSDIPFFEAFISAAETTKEADFESVLPTGYAEDEESGGLLKFLVAEIGRCRFQIGPAEATLVVDLTLLLLQRLKDFPLKREHHAEVTASLVLIGIVGGHVSERTAALLAEVDNRQSFVTRSYDEAKSDTSIAT